MRFLRKLKNNNKKQNKKQTELDVIKIFSQMQPVDVAIVIISVLSVAGTAGNALVIYIFVHQKQKRTSTVFILTLACTDFITSLVTMPFTIVFEILKGKLEYGFVCKIYNFLLTSTVPFSAFIMVAIAVDRYIYTWKKVREHPD